MTIQDLGSVGELIAAIATIATLAYLAIQIRQSTTSTRTATYQAIVSTSIELGNTFSRDGEFAELFVRGVSDMDALTPAERVRLHGHVSSVLRTYELVFHQYEHGAVDQALWQGWRLNMIRFLRFDAYRKVWEATRDEFPPPFREAVDEAISEDANRRDA